MAFVVRETMAGWVCAADKAVAAQRIMVAARCFLTGFLIPGSDGNALISRLLYAQAIADGRIDRCKQWDSTLVTRLEADSISTAQKLGNGSPWRLAAGSTFVIFGIDHKASSHALAFTLRVQVGFIAQSQVDNASLPR